VNIKITNLATQEYASMKLTREQVESLRGILFSGNYFIEVEKKQEKIPSRFEIMNTRKATKGSKVIVTDWSIENGTLYDSFTTCKHLEIGKVYTIANTQMSSWKKLKE